MRRVGLEKTSLSQDPFLAPFLGVIQRRAKAIGALESRLTEGKLSLAEWASGHEYYGLHRSDSGWVFREWAPNATAVSFYGEFCAWDPELGVFLDRINPKGDWTGEIPLDQLKHGELYRLHVWWEGGEGDRLPSHGRRMIQDEHTKLFSAQVWHPDQPFRWKHERPITLERPLLIYEAHVGIAQEHPGIGSYKAFREVTLPKIVKAGYNAIQLMAITEHPYYGSFGYHVSNFFAASSRFGTPEELKELIDVAHGLGLAVIMDIVHSHAVKNELEGLSCFDGAYYQYFHEGARGFHELWDSRCFDYNKPEVLHFLLSNCRYWLDEFRFDGFRFDGVTSMLYYNHGFGVAFTSYDTYFGDGVDEEAYVYLSLANKLIHEVCPSAITIAEDVSGMPGLGAAWEEGGCGFDYRMAMGVPDYWFKLATETRDEDWSVETLYHELTNRRRDERTISYLESHDQALVGGKTFIFELIDSAMYDAMHCGSENLVVERGIAIHKIARLMTLATAGHGYLNFIGNEFGHPEWIDFPREGNQWSYHYARRQWSLRDRSDLRYHFLADFDEAMLGLFGTKAFFDSVLSIQCSHVDEQYIAFQRGYYLLVVNLNPSRSFVDLTIPVAGSCYRLCLDSDAEAYGGHRRLASAQEFVANGGCIKVYSPSRSAQVLRQVE